MAKKHIVSIDDEGFTLKLIESVLSDAYNVTTFQDSKEALEAFKKGLEADLIICDINMPQMDGFELHEALRKQTKLRAIPFIYLTALLERKHFRQGMQQGADDYLTKPFTPSELKEAVAVRFERAETLREKPVLKILSLGGVGASAEDKYLQYEAKKVIALLLYLITHDGKVPLRIVPSDLWHEEVGENNIHVLINRARKTYEGYASFPVIGDVLTLKLEVECDWDAQVFEQAALTALSTKNSSSIEKAILLYKGVFLPSFEAPWAEQQRSYYESLYLKLLELSIDQASNQSSKESARARLEAFLEGA